MLKQKWLRKKRVKNKRSRTTPAAGEAQTPQGHEAAKEADAEVQQDRGHQGPQGREARPGRPKGGRPKAEPEGGRRQNVLIDSM